MRRWPSGKSRHHRTWQVLPTPGTGCKGLARSRVLAHMIHPHVMAPGTRSDEIHLISRGNDHVVRYLHYGQRVGSWMARLPAASSSCIIAPSHGSNPVFDGPSALQGLELQSLQLSETAPYLAPRDDYTRSSLLFISALQVPWARILSTEA